MADTIYKLTHTGQQIDSAIDNAVRSDAQILTSEQQTQARTNIGAVSAAEAQQIIQQSKGWYATSADLIAAWPTGQNGWWAIVGESDTIWTWDSDTTAWVNTGSTSDLSNCYTKTQADDLFLLKTAQSADSAKLGGQAPAYYAKESDLQLLNTITCTATAAGWVGTSAPYTQTVSVPGMAADWVPGIPMLVSSGVVETDLAMRDALACVSLIESSAGALTFACYEDKPTADINAKVPGVI